VCGDTEESLNEATAIVMSLSNAPIIRVLTKSDLRQSRQQQQAVSARDYVDVSATAGYGLAALQREIACVLRRVYGEISAEMPVLTRTRHIKAITQAREEIKAFAGAWNAKSLPTAIATVHLRAAVVALEDVIGAVSTEDVLDRVFGSFCVGK
jgi:tRNA modification GTPase